MNYDEQEKLLAQQRARYQQQQDQQAPQGRMVGNRFVGANPLEYLAAGLRSYGGMRGEQLATQELGDLQKKKQEAMQGDMSAMLAALRGKPAETVQPLTPNDDEGNVNPPIQMPAQAGGINQFYEAALKSQFPQFQKIGMEGMMQMPQIEAQQQEREASRLFRQQEADAARSARIEQMKQDHAFRMERMEADKASDAQKQKADQDFKREMLKITAGNRPAPQAQTLQTENGILERRGNEWVPITVGGKPVMPKASGAGGMPTEGERKAATLLQRMQNSEAQLEAALKLDKTAAKPGLASAALRGVGAETLANTITPENRQKVEAAQLDILDAALTLGTGAAYTKEQLEGYRKSYFPQIGDKPNTIKDKQDRLNNVIEAARIAADRAAGRVTAPPPAAQAFPDANAIAAEIARRKGGK